jgi:hypothetical protein
MAVDTSTVQIRIDIVDENSASTVKGVEQNISGLGNAGVTTGDKVAAGMDKIHGHSLTALDNVRLLRDDIGIRIPRSMEKAIASSQLLMGGINALGTAMLAIGALDIGIRMAEGLEQAYNKYISVAKASDDYYAGVAKNREQDFSNTRSIEDTRVRIAQVTDEIKRLDEAQRQASARGFLFNSINNIVNAHDYAEAAEARRKQLDELIPENARQQHELTLAAIDRDHSSAGLSGQAARDANVGHKLAENDENQKYEAAQDRLLHNTTSSDAGAAKRAIDDATVRENAAREAGKEERTQQQETARMQAEAREVNLRGEELYMDRRNLLVDQLKAKLIATELAPGEYRKQVAAVEEKYDNERLKRLEDQQRATQEIQGEAALAGFKGIGHAQAESDLAVGRIRGDRDLDDQAKDDRVAAEQNRLHFEILDQQREFEDQVNSLADSSAEHQIGGFGRIRAEGTKQLDALQLKFDEVYGQINRNAPGGEEAYQKGVGLLHRGQGAIGTSTADQISDLQRKNAEETSQLESEARAKYMSAEKQQTAAIATEYEQRLEKFKEQLDQQEISQDDYNRRAAAAAQLRDAEMVENANRAREKMASEFTSFFHSLDHPTEALKSLGDKVAGQAAAALVQRAQGRFTGNGVPSQTTNPGDILGSVFDHIGGHKHAPGTAGTPGHAVAAPELASTKMISLATAEIHIQSANLAFGANASASNPGAGGGATAAEAGTPGAPSEFIAGSRVSSSTGAWGSVPGAAGGSTSLLSVPGSAFNAPGGSTVSSAGGFGGGYASSGSTSGAGNAGASARGGGGSSFAGGAGSAAAGAVSAAKNPVGSALGDMQHGVGLLNQAKGIFGQGAATSSAGSAGAGSSDGGGLGDTGPNLAGIFGSNKTTVTGPANNGMLGGGGVMSNMSGAASGALGMYSAVEGNGGIGGALSGAMSGMKLGAALGGPIGAGIGAAAGAVVGAIGFGGREKARVYDLKSVRPRLGNDVDGFQDGAMDYTAAYSDMQALDTEARKTLDAMGGSARAYYWDTINGEIKQAEGKLTAEQRAGRSQMTATAAQYDIGADRIPRDGFAMLHQDERIMPSDQNERITRALENGADSPTMPVQGTSMGDVHFHVNAIDSRSVEKFFMQHGHKIRAALNQTYAENSGSSDSAL